MHNILTDSGIPMKLVRLTKCVWMKPTAQSGQANICLTCFLLGMVWTRRCFIVIAFQLRFSVCHKKGSGKPGWLETKR